MESDTCATCNEGFCPVHNQGSVPVPDILTDEGLSISQHEVERPSCLDLRSNNFSGYVDLSEIGNQAAPSLPSAGTDTTLCPSAIEPYAPAPLPPSPQRIVPLTTQHVVSYAVREAAYRRRRRPLSHFCTDCDASFSSSHNLRYHYDSKHKGELNHPCKYRELGCNFRAAAPRTATRHSRTCKYNSMTIER